MLLLPAVEVWWQARAVSSDFSTVYYRITARNSSGSSSSVLLNGMYLPLSSSNPKVDGSFVGSVSLTVAFAGGGGASKSHADDPAQPRTNGDFYGGAVVAHFQPFPFVDPEDFPGTSKSATLQFANSAGEYDSGRGYTALVPLTEGLGTSEPLYFSNEIGQHVPAHPVTQFTYSVPSDGPLFRTFSIPDALDNGDSHFELMFNGAVLELEAGSEIDFTEYAADGVHEFTLRGISPSEGLSDAPPPFIQSMRFTAEGFAFVTVEPVSFSRQLGDYNLDGMVDAADYTIWRDQYGLTNVNSPADGDLDGNVDDFDFELWRSHFGQVVSGGSSERAAPAPEPGSLILLAVGTIWAINCRIGNRLRRLSTLTAGSSRTRIQATDCFPPTGLVKKGSERLLRIVAHFMHWISARMLADIAAKLPAVAATTNQTNNTNPLSSIRAIRIIRGSPASIESMPQHLRPSVSSAEKNLRDLGALLLPLSRRRLVLPLRPMACSTLRRDKMLA